MCIKDMKLDDFQSNLHVILKQLFIFFNFTYFVGGILL